MTAHDLQVTRGGNLFATALREGAVFLVKRDGKKTLVAEKLNRPTGLVLRPLED